jgi:hypothetical protein
MSAKSIVKNFIKSIAKPNSKIVVSGNSIGSAIIGSTFIIG